MPPTVINDDAVAAIKAFCAALPPLAEPDGFARSTVYLNECADLALAQAGSPLNSEWFSELVARGHVDDLDALCAAFEEADTDAAINVKYRFLQRLCAIAYERDQEGHPVSVMIPAWYEASGWWRAVAWPVYRWNCETKSQAPEPTS